MSFSGFNTEKLDYSKQSKPKPSHNAQFFDPAADMIQPDMQPITNTQITKAQKSKNTKNKRANRTGAKKKLVPAEDDKQAISPINMSESNKNVQRKASVEREEIKWEVNEVPKEKSTNDTTTTQEDSSSPKDIAAVQKKQKELENENKARRQALAREVQSRHQNIIAEAQKLQKIEAEIKKLDELLSYD